jgi:hypothetical protein
LTSISRRAVQRTLQQLRAGLNAGVVDDDACVGCLRRRLLDVLMIGDVEEQRLQSWLVEVPGSANPRVHLGGAPGEQGAGERQADSSVRAGHQRD